jgi:heme exporter protein D
MSEFLAMGGYAWYVWGSYSVTFLLLTVEIALLASRVRRARRLGGPIKYADETKA